MKLNINKLNKEFKKILSYTLITILLLWNTIQTNNFFNTVSAKELDNKDLVSILVDKNIYSWIIKSKIDRYAKDIQDFMPNTQSIIFPIESNTKSWDIALLNEKLFKEWYDNKWWELIWTILIWDVILPTLVDNKKEFISLYPYTDSWFDAVDYRGAFGSDNWAAGWTLTFQN